MIQDPLDYPHGSPHARSLFVCLSRRGGSMRIEPLIRTAGMEPAVLVEAINELLHRGWIKAIWRPQPPGTPDDGTRALRDAKRVVTTKFGRHRYSTSWPSY